MGPSRACYGMGTTSKCACCVTRTLLSGILNGLMGRRNRGTCRILRACGKASLRCGTCRPLFTYTKRTTTGRGGGTRFMAYSGCIAVDSNANVIRVTPTFNRSSDEVKHGCRLPFMRFMSKRNGLAGRAPCTNIFMGGTSPVILASLSGRNGLFSTPGFRRSCPRY